MFTMDIKQQHKNNNTRMYWPVYKQLLFVGLMRDPLIQYVCNQILTLNLIFRLFVL